MCTVSMIYDHFREKWSQPPYVQPYIPPIFYPPIDPPKDPRISDAELADFRKLLERARKYDADNHEQDCEMESKKAAVRKLAEELGVKIDFL